MHAPYEIPGCDWRSLPTINARITRRLSPCACGCSGRDSWHRATYKRNVKNIRPVNFEPVRVLGSRATWYATHRGTIKAPWGPCEVVYVAPERGDSPIFWRIDADLYEEVV